MARYLKSAISEEAKAAEDARVREVVEAAMLYSTMIKNETELRHSIESVARMYSLCDRIAADATGDPDTRTDEAESVQSMIEKIEREIAAYLWKKYAVADEQPEKAA